MPFTTAYRYRLQRYAGPKSRTTCPDCNQPRCFTRYVDTDTGELLPDEYGRCNRETNCGYQLNPYTRPANGGLSYAMAIERNDLPTTYAAPRPARVAPIMPAVLSIPPAVFRATIGYYESNTLAQLLRQHFGLGVANELLKRFQLGTSSYWPGACVFWLIDEQGRARGGQVVLYDETGHTVKHPHRHTTWAHTALAHTHEQHGQPLPTWLTEYTAHGQKSPCLFGLPQLANAPAGKPVALVESAKTAMLATPYMPDYIWLATMGLSYLTADRLEPLRNRRIVLWPDAGALDKWQGKAAELRTLGFKVQVSDELEKMLTPDELKAGKDLADVLLEDWPGYPPSWNDKE
jgi:hypothetical protein